MNRHLSLRNVALFTAAVAALGTAAPATAQEPKSFLTGKFKVEVEGVQKTTWSTNHVQQFECDSNVVGSGKETVRFRSKPVVVHIAKFGESAPIVTFRRKDKGLALLSKITRNGKRTEWGARVCSDGDGTGGTPPEPDCGTKRSTLYADLDYIYDRKDVIGLEQSLAVPLGPFLNCPVGGDSWPALLDRNRNSKQFGAKLPVKDLFEYGKNIVIVRGRDDYDDGDTKATTTIRYSIAMTKMKGKKAR